MSDEPKLVSSGTFRVDRSRMLGKLQQFQLADPSAFILAWVRCAVAGGATKIRAGLGEGGECLEVRFDGLPFRRTEIEDPYSCLLDDTGVRRNRLLAIGCLTAFQAGTSSVSVLSGRGSERVELKAISALDDSLAPAVDGEDDTILRAFLRDDRVIRAALKSLEERCAACADRLVIETGGVPIKPRVPAGTGLVSSEGGPAQAKLEAALRGEGLVQLCVEGVAVQAISPGSLVEVRGFWSDPSFETDLSFASIVRNAAFELAVAGVDRMAEDVLALAIDEQETRMPLLAELLRHPELRETFRGGAIGPAATHAAWGGVPTMTTHIPDLVRAGWLALSGRRPSDKDRAAVWLDGARTAWLRRTLTALSRLSGRSEHKSAARLARVPLFFDGDGKPLSVQDLQSQFSKGLEGFVHRHPHLFWLSTHPNLVWLESSGEVERLGTLLRVRVSERDGRIFFG